MLTFNELYQKYRKDVLRALAYWSVPVQDREDVAQEVWRAVASRIADYDPAQATVLEWLRGIVRCKALHFRRARHRHPEITMEEAPELEDMFTGETFTQRTEGARCIEVFLVAAISSTKQREAFVLHYLHELTVEEVAHALHISWYAAQKRIATARHNVLRAFAECPPWLGDAVGLSHEISKSSLDEKRSTTYRKPDRSKPPRRPGS